MIEELTIDELKRFFEPLDYILDLSRMSKMEAFTYYIDYSNNTNRGKILIKDENLLFNFIRQIDYLTIPIKPENWLGLEGDVIFSCSSELPNAICAYPKVSAKLFITFPNHINFEPEDLCLMNKCLDKLYEYFEKKLDKEVFNLIY